MRTWIWAQARFACLALVLVPAGCGDDSKHEHDHDHDHAEHLDPPHRPSDFPDAIARLLAGHAETREALSAGRVDATLDGLLHVQRDLAKWLPEIAADSDMPEEPWNRVDALAARLLPIYESAIHDYDTGRPLGVDRLAAADPVLSELERLNDEADPDWFPLRAADRDDGETASGEGSLLDGAAAGG